VPEAFRPPPGNERFPQFDGLRAVAALAILASHAAFAAFYTSTGTLGRWTSNLDIGVPIFFVISGFLLYRPFLVARHSGANGPSAGRFYWRRFLRIVPAYWFALTILAIWPLDPATFDEWPKYYFFLQTFTPSTLGIGQAWSLSIEVSFYAILPLYALMVGRITGRLSAGRGALVELALLVALSLVSLFFWDAYANGENVVILLGLPHFLYWFALGMGLALVSSLEGTLPAASSVKRTVARHPWACWALAGALFVAAGFLTEVPRTGIAVDPATAMAKWLIQPLIALLIVAPAVFTVAQRRSPGRILTWQPIAWLGLISYGLYLWHLAVVKVIFDAGLLPGASPGVRAGVGAVLTLLVTIPIAAASYYLIERPFLRLKKAEDVLGTLKTFTVSHFTLLATFVSALSAALMTALLRGGWFLGDDFLNLDEARVEGLTPELLTSPVFGERFSPGHRFLDWVVIQFAPDAWPAVVVLSAGFAAVAAFLVAVLVKRISGVPAIGLAAALLFATSITWPGLGSWWAASAHSLPAVALSVGALTCVVSWRDHRRLAAALGAVVLTLVALMFSVRSVFVIPLAFVLSMVPPATTATPADATRSLGSRALSGVLICTPLVIAGVVVTWLDLTATIDLGPSLPDRSLRDWLGLSWHWLTDGFLPLLANSQPALTSSPAAKPIALVGGAFLAGLAAMTVRNAASALVWIAMLLLVLLAGLQVGVARFAQFGFTIVEPLRYHEIDLLIAVILIPAAWLVAGRPRPRSGTQAALVGAFAVALGVTWVGQGISTLRSYRTLPETELAARGQQRAKTVTSRATLATLENSLGAIAANERSLTIVDNRMPPGFGDGDSRRLERVVGTFLPNAPVSFFGTNGAPVLVDPTGSARVLNLGDERRLIPGRSVCLRSTVGSDAFSAGASRATIKVGRDTGRLRTITIAIREPDSRGRLGLIFQPSSAGFPDIELSATEASRGVRVLLPAGTEAVTLVASDGLEGCVRDAMVASEQRR